MAPPRVVIVGFGRVGGALAIGLRKAGWPVSVFVRTREAAQRARRRRLPLADEAALNAADVCVVAVPDRAVAKLAAALRPHLAKRALLVHCAGALPLTPLGPGPAGSFHPLMAISDPSADLEGAWVAVASNRPAGKRVLRSMAAALGLNAFSVPEGRRAQYHASAVLSAGLLVTQLELAVSVMTRAGVARGDAHQALLSLAKSALSGVEQRGLRGGLTGPIARQDFDVVHAHLRALPADARGVYETLSRRMGALLLDKAAQKRLANTLAHP